MDGMHDMGGRQGFGAVRYTLNALETFAAARARSSTSDRGQR